MVQLPSRSLGPGPPEQASRSLQRSGMGSGHAVPAGTSLDGARVSEAHFWSLAPAPP